MKKLSWSAALAFLVSCSSGVSSGPPSAAPVMPEEAPAGGAREARAPANPEAPELLLGDEVVPTGYEVKLDLDPNADDFGGAVAIEVEVREPRDHLWLHGTGLTVESAALERDGDSIAMTPLEVDSDDFIGFSFAETVAPGPATLRIAYRGEISSKDLEGVFKQQEGDRWYLYTQFEATSARRAFPCFDEPRFKVPWELSITVGDGDEAFANTPVAQERKDGDRRTVRFARTKPLPSYLVAFAVGPFEVVDAGTGGRNETPLRVIVPRGRTAETAHALGTLPVLLSRLEDYFDMGYPYEKLDSIALPRFFGAMENPGLVTYDAGILLTKPEEKTARFERRHANVVAHELAHQWFGNLVTMGWWDDIWLNESFATWMAAKVVHEWKPEWEGEVSAVAGRDRAMEADRLVNARKIRQPIESDHDIARAFDAISYAKGGAVLTMFERWIGKDAFRDGVRAYMKEHAWGNATSADFLSALGGASEAAVTEAFSTFLDQPGVPVLEVELKCDDVSPPALVVEQQRFLPMGTAGSSEQRWKLPVCVKYGDRRSSHTQCELVTEERATIALSEARTCPSWVLPNAEGAGYYRTDYPDEMLPRLFAQGRRHLTVADRVGIVGDVSALVAAGRLGIGDSLALVPTLLQDRSDHVIGEAVSIVAGLDGRILPTELEPNYARLVRKLFGKRARQLGWVPRKGESDTVRMMRPRLVTLVARKGGDKSLARAARRLTDRWLDERKGIHREMLDAVLGTAAYHGDAVLYDRMLEAALETDDRRERGRLLTAMSSFRGKELAERNLQVFLDKGEDLDPRQSMTLLQGPLSRSDTRAMAYQFVKDNYETIAERLPVMARGYVVFAAAAFCDQAHMDDARAFFGPIAEDIPGAPRMLEQALEQVQLCMAFKASQQPKLEAFLKKH